MKAIESVFDALRRLERYVVGDTDTARRADVDALLQAYEELKLKTGRS